MSAAVAVFGIALLAALLYAVLEKQAAVYALLLSLGAALALLVREKPLTAQQLSAALTEKGTRLDRKQLGKILAKLERAGAVETAAGKYICQNETILHYPTTYSESQLLDIIGMTQNTVNGQAVFSGVPPMSISSRGSSGV